MRNRKSSTPALAAILLLFAASFRPGAVDAGCGCDKPPPPVASIRPAFASPGNTVSLFPNGLVVGRRYSVTFGDPGVTLDATAVFRRDFADGTVKPQLVVAAPAVPSGPTTVTVKDGASVLLQVAAADFTMMPPPLVLLEGNVKTLVTSYQAAVASDGTVYFPLDISAIAEAASFDGRAIGYRLTFGASDVVIYNTQGVLMQLLAPGDTALYEIDDDPDAPEDSNDGGSPAASRSFKLKYNRHEFMTYLSNHDSNPNFAINPADPMWHVDGTRHIDHFHLVVAIVGLVDGTTAPAGGRTPSFTFRVKTKVKKEKDKEHGHGHDEDQPKDRVIDATAGSPGPAAGPACAVRPLTSCDHPTEAGASRLTIKKRNNPLRDQLAWLWAHGESSSPRVFGDLRGRHGVAFCLYDESTPTPTLLLQSGIAGGGACRKGKKDRSCWSRGDAASDKPLRYGNLTPTPGGIAKLMLAGGGGKNAMIALKTLGNRGALPSLPLGLPVRAQLQSTNGECWDATYSTGVEKNRADRFDAASD